MDVYDAEGRKVGRVAQVVVGNTSGQQRLFVIEKGLVFKHDYLVPHQAVRRVDERGAHLEVERDRIQQLPEYEGQAPSPGDVRRAYTILGGRETPHGFEFERREDATRAPEAHVVTIEEYFVLRPEEDHGQATRGLDDRDEPPRH